MGDITIGEDDLEDDEYDFMDEDGDARNAQQREKEQRRTPQYKYKMLLQKLADRTIDEIRIDLDDVLAVRWLSFEFPCWQDAKAEILTFASKVGETRRGILQSEACPIGRDEHKTLCGNPIASRRQRSTPSQHRC